MVPVKHVLQHGKDPLLVFAGGGGFVEDAQQIRVCRINPALFWVAQVVFVETDEPGLYRRQLPAVRFSEGGAKYSSQNCGSVEHGGVHGSNFVQNEDGVWSEAVNTAGGRGLDLAMGGYETRLLNDSVALDGGGDAGGSGGYSQVLHQLLLWRQVGVRLAGYGKEVYLPGFRSQVLKLTEILARDVHESCSRPVGVGMG